MGNAVLELVVDVDDVVLDFIPAWIGRYNALYGDNVKVEDVNQWDMTKVCPKAGSKVYDILREPGFYKTVQPIPGALEAIHAARFFGIDILFASSCVVGSTDEKVMRLMELGFLPNEPTPVGFMAAKAKHRIRGNYFIDDNADNVEAWIAEHGKGTAFLVNKPHNANQTTRGCRVDHVAEAIRRAWIEWTDPR